MNNTASRMTKRHVIPEPVLTRGAEVSGANAKRTKGQGPRRKVWDHSRKDVSRDAAARGSDGQH